MPTLRQIRSERTAFEPLFFTRSALFSPIERAAGAFATFTDWPEPDDLTRAFAGALPVRFVAAAPRSRRAPRRREDLYDAVIVRDRVVPTRPRMWHDFLNALVWATFPRAKLALHERQHRAIEAWIPEGATALPNARTRELDMLALVDEGGVLTLEPRERETPGARLVFGHALYEGLVLDNRAMIARAVVLRVPAVPTSIADQVRVADEALAGALRDDARLEVPDDLPRVRL